MDMSHDIMRSQRGRVRGASFQGRGARGSFGTRRMTGTGMPHQGPLRVNARPSTFSIAKSFRRSKNFPWRQDLFEESLAAAGLAGTESGTKLFISNLDSGVSNDDIRELFSEIGGLKRYAIHFDKNGQPSGSAEVVYAKRSDAFAALKRYHNVQLDGRPMKIEILSPNLETTISARVNVIGSMNGRTTRKVVMEPGRDSTRSLALVNRVAGPRARGGLRPAWKGERGGLRNGQGYAWRGARGGSRTSVGRGRGRGPAKKKWVEKSAEQLDKELDKYHAEAMQS
ncbi:hypothetical protein Nepgr_028674 [Nepenthes gracilis]|uniref:RRM domain-containing protein n=1 Tax=Nepenthes gracilis TaxID=150966 RepID=A0AAD3TCZ1_NEPGR|nr:hypothetical protein Nepgr_028674 [Nepenthes gracilis]